MSAETKQEDLDDGNDIAEVVDASEISDDDDSKHEKSDATDDDDSDVAEYFSESEDDNDGKEELSLAEQLEAEKKNMKQARTTIANLIAQVTDYQVSAE